MKKIFRFLKSFYVVLCVCVIAVSVVCISFFTKYLKEQNIKKMALYSPHQYVEIKEKEETKTVQKIIEPEKKSDVPEKNVSEEKEVMSVLKEEEFEIILPVGNEIINSFSKDELVFSKTFGDYRVHNGIDIKSERGKPVLAVYDGVVEDVYTDALEGIVIKIDHLNGYETVYKNLSGDKMVKKGESVVKGQAISGVGETAVFEAVMESHIHFELLKDGEFVNPEEYII